jgi:hypothetical protein
MICRSCRDAADYGRPDEHCHNETWCDCQHKPKGTLINEKREEGSPRTSEDAGLAG